MFAHFKSYPKWITWGFVLLVSGVLLVLVSYTCLVFLTPEPGIPVGETSLLDTASACGVRCLWGLTPGESTVLDAEHVLQDRKVMEGCEYTDELLICNHISFGLNYDQGLITLISFNPSPQPTLGELIAVYGEPTGVQAYRTGIEHPSSFVWLCFEEPLIATLTRQVEGMTTFIGSDTRVYNVEYHSTQTYPERCSMASGWQGYREYGEMP